MTKNILPNIRHINISGMVGGMLEFLTHGESFEKVCDEGLKIGRRIVRKGLPVMRRYILKELPVLWPEWFGKKEAANGLAKHIIGKLKEQIDAIEKDPDHATRKAIQRQLQKFIQKMNTSSEYRETALGFIENIISNPTFSGYVANLWKELKLLLKSKVNQPDNAMKERIESVILGIGASLKKDPLLAQKLHESFETVMVSAFSHFAPEIQKMIEKTVTGWSESRIVSTLEPVVGRDLQFIRINGTIVGGLAGLAIYALSLLFPH
jgi:uncharacterized membrane-anchored protein YjiN (DUF445 family)